MDNLIEGIMIFWLKNWIDMASLMICYCFVGLISMIENNLFFLGYLRALFQSRFGGCRLIWRQALPVGSLSVAFSYFSSDNDSCLEYRINFLRKPAMFTLEKTFEYFHNYYRGFIKIFSICIKAKTKTRYIV